MMLDQSNRRGATGECHTFRGSTTISLYLLCPMDATEQHGCVDLLMCHFVIERYCGLLLLLHFHCLQGVLRKSCILCAITVFLQLFNA